MHRMIGCLCACALLTIGLSIAGAGMGQQKAATPPKPAVPFVENDYGKALQDAQRRNVPLFVDLWAPW